MPLVGVSRPPFAIAGISGILRGTTRSFVTGPGGIKRQNLGDSISPGPYKHVVWAGPNNPEITSAPFRVRGEMKDRFTNGRKANMIRGD